MPDKDYTQRVTNMVQYILNEANKDEQSAIEPSLAANVNRETNPMCNVMPDDGSLLLEEYYGMPKLFHTSLGKFEISSRGWGDHTKLMSHLKIKFGLVVLVPGKQRTKEFVGPIYAVTRDLDGNPFPLPAFQSLCI